MFKIYIQKMIILI